MDFFTFSYFKRQLLSSVLIISAIPGIFYAESLLRTYPEAPQIAPESLLAPTNAVVEAIIPLQTLDEAHQEAILDALEPAMGLPGPLNYTVNCFVAQRGNTPLYLISKYVKEYCGIEVLDLIFDYNEALTLPKARLLILDIVDGLTYEINQRPKARELFAVNPITSDQIAVRIRVNPPNCGLSYPALGNIATVTAMDGVVSYGTLNSISREIDTLRTESYDQAEAIASRPN